MSEIFPTGQEINDNEYQRRLGVLFDKKRAGYVRFAGALLLKLTPFAETDRNELAKDLVQETFLKLLRNRSIDFGFSDNQIEFYAAENVKTSVYGWVERYRRDKAKNPFKIPEKKYSPLGEEAENMTDPSPESDPQLLLERESLKRVIMEALETLDPSERRILEMHYGLLPYEKEFTLEEISQELNVSPSRIAQIQARALRKMGHPKRGGYKLEDYLYRKSSRGSLGVVNQRRKK